MYIHFRKVRLGDFLWSSWVMSVLIRPYVIPPVQDFLKSDFNQEHNNDRWYPGTLSKKTVFFTLTQTDVSGNQLTVATSI